MTRELILVILAAAILWNGCLVTSLCRLNQVDFVVLELLLNLLLLLLSFLYLLCDRLIHP